MKEHLILAMLVLVSTETALGSEAAGAANPKLNTNATLNALIFMGNLHPQEVAVCKHLKRVRIVGV
jgi:hypothetical protein